MGPKLWMCGALSPCMLLSTTVCYGRKLMLSLLIGSRIMGVQNPGPGPFCAASKLVLMLLMLTGQLDDNHTSPF